MAKMWTSEEKNKALVLMTQKWPDVLAGKILVPDVANMVGEHVGKEPPHATTIGSWARDLGLPSPRGAITNRRALLAEKRRANMAMKVTPAAPSAPQSLFSQEAEDRMVRKLDQILDALRLLVVRNMHTTAEKPTE